jgi:hypothetical protein
MKGGTTRRHVLAGAGALAACPALAAEPLTVLVNGRLYRAPRRPTVVICVDGFDPTYLQQ